MSVHQNLAMFFVFVCFFWPLLDTKHSNIILFFLLLSKQLTNKIKGDLWSNSWNN